MKTQKHQNNTDATTNEKKKIGADDATLVERGSLLDPDYVKHNKSNAAKRRKQEKQVRREQQRVEKQRKHNNNKHADSMGKKKRPALITFDGDADTSTLKMWIIIAVAVALAGGCYALGIWVNKSWLITLAFIIIVATVIFWIWQKRASTSLTDEQIEEAVVEYRRDLMKSYEGYDVEFDIAEVNAAVEEYRELLIEENTSIAELSPSMMVAAIKDSRARTKQLEEQAKQSR